MRPGAAPLWEQVMILVLGPPIMACLFWLKARGWANNVQGGSVGERTKNRQKLEFWVLMAVMYILGFGIMLYSWLT